MADLWNEPTTDPAPADGDDETMASAVDDIGRRAGAALRRPAPSAGLGDVVTRGTHQRRVRTGLAAAGAVALIGLVGGGLLLAINEDASDKPGPIVTTPEVPDRTDAVTTTVAVATTSATAPTAAAPADPVAVQLAEDSLLSPENIGAEWTVDDVTPPFVLDADQARDVANCSRLVTTLFEPLERAGTATRQLSTPTAHVRQYVAVLPDEAIAQAVYDEVVGQADRPGDCFRALLAAASGETAVVFAMITPDAHAEQTFDGGIIRDQGFRPGEVPTDYPSVAFAHEGRVFSIIEFHMREPGEVRANVIAPRAMAKADETQSGNAPEPPAASVPDPANLIRTSVTLVPEAFSPLSGRFAGDASHVVAFDYEGHIGVWDATTGEQVGQFPPLVSGERYQVSANGTRVFDGTVVWDVVTGERISTLVDTPVFEDVTFSPDASRLTVFLGADEDRRLAVFDVATGNRITDLPVEGFNTMNPDATRVLGWGGFDEPYRMWDVSSGQQLWERPSDSTFGGVEFSPDGSSLLVSVPGGWARLDAATGTELDRHEVGAVWAEFSADRSLAIARGTVGDDLTIYDVVTGREVFSVSGLPSEIPFIRELLSPDGALVAVPATDGMVRVIDVASGEVRATLTTAPGEADVLTFSPDSTQILTIGGTGEAKVWQLP